MTVVALRVITRVVKRRYDAGEDFEEIIKDYPKLSNKEIQDIKDALGISDTPEEEAEDEKA